MNLSSIEKDLEAVASVLAKVKDIFDRLQSSETALQIEARIPGAAGFIARMGGEVALLGAAPQIVAGLEAAIAAYRVLKSLGMKPADQDSLYWQRQEENDRTGG
jgi:hypothetical protein